ncbi:hypothetical protein K8I61_08315 [bacterium]|nr:hypothetical protein [bacterium]
MLTRPRILIVEPSEPAADPESGAERAPMPIEFGRRVTRRLRDAGCEVIFLSLTQGAAFAARVAVQEDVRAVLVLGVSNEAAESIARLVEGLAAEDASDIRVLAHPAPDPLPASVTAIKEADPERIARATVDAARGASG